MNRKHTVEEYLEVKEKLTKVKPGIKFSSDFIIGYPGETDRDFEETIELMTKIGFINSFSFITALAWNSAFQATFESISELNLIGPWVYALFITLICVCVTKCTEKMLAE